MSFLDIYFPLFDKFIFACVVHHPSSFELFSHFFILLFGIEREFSPVDYGLWDLVRQKDRLENRP